MTIDQPHTPIGVLLGREIERGEAERLVAFLIENLDQLDGDPDLEPDDEDNDTSDFEPSLGWTPLMNQPLAMHFNHRVDRHEGEFGGDTVEDDNLEEGADAELDINDQPQLDDSDDERTLGWTENVDQTNLAATVNLCEDDGRGFEEEIASRFRTPDVRQAKDHVREQLREMRMRRLRGPGLDPDTLRALHENIIVLGRVR